MSCKKQLSQIPEDEARLLIRQTMDLLVPHVTNATIEAMQQFDLCEGCATELVAAALLNMGVCVVARLGGVQDGEAIMTDTGNAVNRHLIAARLRKESMN